MNRSEYASMLVRAASSLAPSTSACRCRTCFNNDGMAGGRRPGSASISRSRKWQAGRAKSGAADDGRHGSLPTCEIEIYGDYGRVGTATYNKAGLGNLYRSIGNWRRSSSPSSGEDLRWLGRWPRSGRVRNVRLGCSHLKVGLVGFSVYLQLRPELTVQNSV
jgi:hypothetical protein